ncbi:short-chain dehydrogenase/reductase family protein [Cavenderia fasciculata]|uniref:Short-chain dehydrogenase/reductase family protein n=1 Tax=Cavenderia fasciculata TaxID=261658 RepID=F4Q0D1_CACFS|nr:short-chain dehydrogenase/reductase family protein [Cavenderia fasciculata]EGG18282.1 short-chain dehydrogenase/reductase family protein [Cavenderia fasciculata]|eukprot:XP_004357105.1 short-chain dehydrogenase/reductase family protein [Cavenderia fasciculata]
MNMSHSNPLKESAMLMMPSEDQEELSKVWFITGCSKGLGLALSQHLLEKGYRVASTSRYKSELEKELGPDSKQFLGVQMDITNEKEIKSSIDSVMKYFGRIDFVVNNAAYCQLGTVEELTNQEIQSNFLVNYYGTVNVLRHVSPILRSQKSGHVFNVSSVAGFTNPFPGWSSYAATKHAIDGMTECYAEEMKIFGVRVSLISPGAFQTSFLSTDHCKVPSQPNEAYAECPKLAHDYFTSMGCFNHMGDSKKYSELIVQIANIQETDKVPKQLFVGADAFKLARAKIDSMTKQLDYWEPIASKMDLDSHLIKINYSYPRDE